MFIVTDVSLSTALAVFHKFWHAVYIHFIHRKVVHNFHCDFFL